MQLVRWRFKQRLGLKRNTLIQGAARNFDPFGISIVLEQVDKSKFCLRWKLRLFLKFLWLKFQIGAPIPSGPDLEILRKSMTVYGNVNFFNEIEFEKWDDSYRTEKIYDTPERASSAASMPEANIWRNSYSKPGTLSFIQLHSALTFRITFHLIKKNWPPHRLSLTLAVFPKSGKNRKESELRFGTSVRETSKQYATLAANRT